MVTSILIALAVSVPCGQLGRDALEKEVAELTSKVDKQKELMESLKKQGRTSLARDKARAVRTLSELLETKKSDLAAITEGYGLRLSDLAGDEVLKEVIFDLPAVAGRGPAYVIKILGKPDRIEETVNKGRKFPKYFWKPKSPNFDGEFGAKEHSVVFIAGKADWISIAGTGSLDYDVIKAFRAMNLPAGASPTVVSRADIRWENGAQPGYRYLSIGDGRNGKVCSIYVNVFTRP